MKTFGPIFFLLIMVTGISLSAQNSTWYFGGRCGLDFSSGNPVAITSGMMKADEGCVTITNNSNQVLFYSNGDTVWNANHVPMANGTGLNGQLSSSQSCLAIRKPGSTTIWYLFTTAAQGNPGGLCYSEIDMSMNSGLGAVTVKNTQLVTPCCEKLAAVRHANGIDIWVVAHPLNSGSYYAYLVTGAGISAPVNSLIGGSITSALNGQGAIGCMKFSCDGSKLAVAQWLIAEIQLYDFNTATGVISNYRMLDFIYKPYGVEFSATGQFLYVTTEYQSEFYLFQFDVTQANIPNTEVILDTIPAGENGLYGLQLGPDHKIYCSRLFEDSLAVINNPDLPGMSCGFVVNGLYLGGRTSFYGLPNFLPADYCLPANPDAVEEQSANDLVSVYPNPVKDVFTIDAGKLDNQYTVSITNALGESVYATNSSSEILTIDMSGFSSGIYFIRVESINITSLKKVVVE